MIVLSLSASTFASIQVHDFLGRKVVLKEPAQRVIGLAPHIVENIYSAGAGDTLVGAVDYCDYPEAAKKIPRVGAISSHSLEAIIALKPDLVVVWHSGHGGKILTKLVKLGMTVYASDPRNLSDVAKSIRDFGHLTGHAEQAENVARRYEYKLEHLDSAYKSKEPVPTLYQVWDDPLQTLNDKHIISDVIRLCGGTNVFGDALSLAPKISIESVIARNPHAIVASGMGEERPDWLNDWKKWPLIEAVRKNQLFFVPPDIIQRHTYRILEGAEALCRHLDSARNEEVREH